MAWGRSAPKPPPPPRSALSKLLPLIVLFLVLATFTFIGYHLYVTVQKISAATNDKMQAKNVVFTKDGMKVGVKELKTESYVDTTQGFLVKAWTLSEWPAYKSRLWNKPVPGGQVDSRKPYSRTTSTK